MSKEVIFENLQRVATAIATQFGPDCEALLHDLGKPESSIVFLAGDVTGRRVGGPVTDLVLERIAASDSPEDVIDYTSHTRDGRTLTSSTVFLRGTDNQPIGVFCINFDVTDLLAARDTLSEIVSPSTPIEVDKSFSTDVPDLLDSIIQESLGRVLGESHTKSSLGKSKRQILVADLDARGVFQIQNSVPSVAETLGVSRYTIYKDLKELRNQEAPVLAE